MQLIFLQSEYKSCNVPISLWCDSWRTSPFILLLIMICLFINAGEAPLGETEKVVDETLATKGDIPRIIIITVSVVGTSLLILNIVLVICFVRKRRKKRLEEGRAPGEGDQQLCLFSMGKLRFGVCFVHDCVVDLLGFSNVIWKSSDKMIWLHTSINQNREKKFIIYIVRIYG